MKRPVKVALGMVVAAAVAAAGLLVYTLRYGFSAHDDPTSIEHFMARAMRKYATPADLRGRKNPVALTPEVLVEARAHFADHCATCHGNDGKGRTSMGPRFYPKVPDMTLAETQSQSDGELFATIENGIRLTGMPAWGDGTAASAYGSWTLVHFIRHLPKITAEEIAEMEGLNPRPRAEWAAAEEEEAFLRGEGGQGEEAPPSAPAPKGHH